MFGSEVLLQTRLWLQNSPIPLPSQIGFCGQTHQNPAALPSFPRASASLTGCVRSTCSPAAACLWWIYSQGERTRLLPAGGARSSAGNLCFHFVLPTHLWQAEFTLSFQTWENRNCSCVLGMRERKAIFGPHRPESLSHCRFLITTADPPVLCPVSF